RRAEGLDDAEIVGGMGEVAACAARHEDLDARLAVLLQQQRAAPLFRGPRGGQQAGGARAGNNHVPVTSICRQACPLGLRRCPSFRMVGPRCTRSCCFSKESSPVSTDRISEYLAQFSQTRTLMLDQLRRIIVGQAEVIEQILAAIFTRGHCLLVGVPGLAKTLMVSSISPILYVSYKRIQFTPDLM